MAQHVHNAVYLQWFEQARMDLMRKVTPPVTDRRTEGLILARNEVDYKMPVHLNDVIEVECWCGAIGGKSFELHYAVHRINGEKPGICATGKSIMVCFNYVKNITVEIPADRRTALKTIERK